MAPNCVCIFKKIAMAPNIFSAEEAHTWDFTVAKT